MSINIRQLEAFVEVARLGSFSRAADRLHMSQAGLSILIRKLEDGLGVRAFERTTRVVTLTEAGRDMLGSAQRILADLDALSATAREAGAQRAARIAFALPPRFASTRLPGVLRCFHEANPGISVSFRECINEEMTALVQARDVDFGLGFGIEPTGELDCEPIGEDSLVAVFPATHPFARKRALRWRDLAGERVITLPATSAARALIEQQFAQAGLALAPVYEGNSLVAMALAREGLGVAVVSARTAGPDITGDLVQRVLREPTVTRALLVVTRRIAVLPEAARALIALFADAAPLGRPLDGPGMRPLKRPNKVVRRNARPES
jgi:LysR family carnitine catabolism transcriptional activator